ncbi:hypothetical protein BDQ12DRAFT_140402 [Crucibulum laeve]|uniref:Translocation protein SEC62 n=1 Tax=Crucibulum laeve TaxID=68775 RepID=A0A5C3LX79_9AGAR|nr:hypothetical protein BDQ12DRAFT_140402 [Crucibulum laeve]
MFLLSWLRWPPFLQLPFIQKYSLFTQLAILFVLLLVSYLHRRARFGITALICVYFGYKILVPVVRIIAVVVKAVAWVGFYIHFFMWAVRMGWVGLQYFFNDILDPLLREMEKNREEEKEEQRAKEKDEMMEKLRQEMSAREMEREQEEEARNSSKKKKGKGKKKETPREVEEVD